MDENVIAAWVDGVLQPLDKLEVHRRGLRHPAVSVFLVVGDHYLWQQRAAGKYHSGGLWANTCCTHPAWGEPAAACAARRLDQELGLTGLALTPLARVEYRAAVGNGLIEHELVDVFLAEAATRPALCPDPAEVADTRWRSLAETDADIDRHPDRFTAWIKLYLTDHRAELFGRNAASGKSDAAGAAWPP
jgi:isopentenyl-diphosphate delta-isomerase